MPYLSFIRSITRRRSAGSPTIRARPSTTTASEASSVLTQQRGSAARLRTLREAALLVNHSTASSHMAHTGMVCGWPSGHTVVTQ